MNSTTNLSVALFGPDIDHKRSLEAMLAGRVSKLTWLPDSISLYWDRSPTYAQRIQMTFDRLTCSHDRSFLNAAIQHFNENHTDVIVAYWGTRPLSDILAIKKLLPQIKIVLMVLCFPLALDTPALKRQHWLMRHAAPCLDGMLYPNTVMQDYFRCQVLRKRGTHLKELLLRPCWPKSYQSVGECSEQIFDQPNLIFVGRTDLSGRTIHAADDLRPLMAEILENRILLSHARSPETTDGHPYRRPFDPLDQAGLTAKMSAYDASLIAYNAAACRRTERLELTVPDRLLTSVAAGVPVAIPSIGYQGAKEYLADYPAVIEFDSVPNLKSQLDDRERVHAMRKAAWDARALYFAEPQGDRLAPFLSSICNSST